MGKLLKALSNDKNIRYYSVDTTDIIKEIVKIHNPSPGAMLALAKIATFAAIYGPSILSDKEKVTIKIEGNGTIGTVYADTNKFGEVKIMCTNPNAEIPMVDGKLDVDGVIGHSGKITVIKDMGMKENYVAISPILSEDISKTFSYFMKISEQIPSAVGLGINFNENGEIIVCGGYMVQVLPGASDEQIEMVERNVTSSLNPTTMLLEFSHEEMLEMLSRNDYRIIEELDTKFSCDCSKDRFSSKVMTLGRKELNEIFSNDSKIEIICEFCKTKYNIEEGDVNKLLDFIDDNFK